MHRVNSIKKRHLTEGFPSDVLYGDLLLIVCVGVAGILHSTAGTTATAVAGVLALLFVSDKIDYDTCDNQSQYSAYSDCTYICTEPIKHKSALLLFDILCKSVGFFVRSQQHIQQIYKDQRCRNCAHYISSSCEPGAELINHQ